MPKDIMLDNGNANTLQLMYSSINSFRDTMAAKLKPCSESSLTDRYQTTVPEPVRKVLDLKKRDKISYTIESDGKVVMSRVENKVSDPILGKFLSFIAHDIVKNPQHLQAISSGLVNHVQSLVSEVEIDLDAPLLDEDE